MNDELQAEVEQTLQLEQQLAERESELMADPRFREFIEFQKTTVQQIAEFWKDVETRMIERDIKSIKGDWGSLTIAERLDWNTSDELPAKFYKKVVDKKRITDTYRLEGKAPKGAEPKTLKFLTKRFK